MTAPNPLIHRARRLRDQGRHQDAYTCLQLLNWPQQSPEFYLLKGSLERQLGLTREALSSLSIALAHPPHHGLTCYEIGELERSRGLFDDAASWFLAALRSAPRHHWIHHSLQYTRFNESMLPLVVAEYEKHCQKYTDDATGLHLLAQWQIRLGKTEAAIRSSQTAARMNLGPQQAWLAPAQRELTPPDFIIIGAPKSGTTSLLSWLGQHPKIWCHPRKELHFFNGAWQQGKHWYFAQFPQFEHNSGIRRGEATPHYFLTPHVAERIAETAPQARLILILRDPLQRAISWIEHLKRYEGLQGSTEELLLEELHLLEQLPTANSFVHTTSPASHQALWGSCYDPALMHWKGIHSNSLLILRSEDLFNRPSATLKRCTDFLDVPPMPTGQNFVPANVNTRPASRLSDSARTTLEQFLQRWNREWHSTARAPKTDTGG